MGLEGERGRGFLHLEIIGEAIGVRCAPTKWTTYVLRFLFGKIMECGMLLLERILRS